MSDAADEEALRRIVRDEATRMRVRGALEEETGGKPGKSAFRKMVEHPAGRLVFGFILTGVIGQWLSWTYAERKEAEELQRASLQAVRDFATLEQSRRAKFVAARSAILNGAAPEDVSERKKAYDQAYVEWSSQLQAQRLRFREYFGFARRHPIESAIDLDFLPVWSRLHSCLTNSASHYAKGDERRAREVFKLCGGFKPEEGLADAPNGSRVLLDTAHDCAYEISSYLSEQIMAGLDCGDQLWRDDGVRVYAAFSDICDPKRRRQAAVDDAAPWRYKTPRENAARWWPYALTPAERRANPDRAAKLDRDYDRLCVDDDHWFERKFDGRTTSDPAFSSDAG